MIPYTDDTTKQKILEFIKSKGFSQEMYAAIKAIPNGEKVLKAGDKALYLETLKPLANSELSALKGKIVFVDNWATWCGACIKNINAFIKNKVTLPKGVVMAFINCDRKITAAKNFVKKTPFPKKQVLHFFNTSGQKGAYAKYYNIKMLPHYFVIGKDGNILDMNPPHPNDEKFESYLKKITK